jgi:chemotaxis protein CheZ
MTMESDQDSGLVMRHRQLLEELAGLVDYIEETRRTLGGMHSQLPAASDALSAVTATTEKATHNILELVEKLMDEDQRVVGALETVRTAADGSEDPALKAASEVLVENNERREMMLTEMMSELSFQDLTCQAINRISKTIVEIERRIVGLVDRNEAPAHARQESGHSGLERLRETYEGANKQGQIDDLFTGLTQQAASPSVGG